MPTRRDFIGDNGKVCGDTWLLVLPFTAPEGAEVSMTFRRFYMEPTSVLCVITNGTDSVSEVEGGGGTEFRLERGVTAAFEPGSIWYDAKAYDAETNELFTHWYGQVQALPTGDPDGIPDDSEIPEFGSDALHGVRGGGALHPLAIADGAAGFMSGAEKAALAALIAGEAGEVPPTRAIAAGAGLTGGGDLLADRSIAVGANADGSIVVNADDVQVGVLASDVQHGARGGGSQHAVVVAAGAAGFMSGADKTKLDGIAAGAGVPSSRALTAGAGLTGGGDLSADRSLVVGAHVDGSIVVGADDVRVGVLASDAQHGTRGGGTQHADVVAAGASGFMSGADKTKLDGITAGAGVPASRTLTAGTGLTGGGDLAADRTLNVAAHADGSIVVGADDVRVGVLASDAQHGNRGGGAVHAAAIAAGASGFMTGADKTKLDGIAAGATVAPVASVFGRVGAVVAVAADYVASLISNDSAVTGSTVKAALEALLPKAGGTLTGPVKSTPTAVSFSSTPSFDLAAGDDFALGLITSNFAITLANPAVGQSGEIAMVQNGTGGWKITAITVSGYTVKVEGNSSTVNSTEFKVASSNSVLAYRLCTINGVNICFIAVIPSTTPSYA